LQRLVQSPKNAVALATLDGEPDVFLGWACGAAGVLHYVYVKHAFRENGIARDLVEAVAGVPTVYTFEPATKEGEARRKLIAVAERKGWKLHAHPVPGVLVRKQLQAREDTST
jgi:GNAT superfamily N-acetyltransferase